MKAYLDGHLLDADSGAGWAYVVGPRPHVRTIEVELNTANKLMEGATTYGSELVLDSTQEGLGVERIRALTILGTGPSSSPYTRTLVFADRRWTWDRTWVRRSYNYRRKSGERRLVGEGLQRAAKREADIDSYAAWSLKGEIKRWTGNEALEDALVLIAARDGFGLRTGGVLSGLSLVDVEGLELDEYSDQALSRVFAYFGLAIGVYIEDDGTAVLTNRLDDGEFRLVGAPVPSGGGALKTTTRDQTDGAGIGPPLVGDPLWDVQDRRMERPREVRVYFTRAVELRVDYQEAGQSERLVGGVEPPRWSNVLPAPEDLALSGRSVIRGTWITFLEYVNDFLAKQAPLIADLPKLTLKVAREQFLGPIGLMAYAWPRLDLGGVWQRRVAPFYGHYRLTLRLQRKWLDRIRNMRAYRVAVEDISTGGRAPSPVYADHAVWLTGRPIESLTENDPPEAHEIVRNVLANEEGGPGNVVGTAISELVPATALLKVVDEDQGVVQVNYLLDLEGKTMRVIRSAIEPLSIPTDDFAQDKVYLGNGILTEDHQISTVVTVVAGSPNDMRQFHIEVVKPEDVLPKMPTSRIGKAEGPPMEIRISAAVTQARFAWDDAKAAKIYRSFTTDDAEPQLGFPTNQQEVRDVAIAEAARVYVSMVDHVEGSLTAAFSPGTRPRGAVASVSHEAGTGPSGGMTTTLDLPPEPPRMSFDAFLPAGTRKIVRRMVEP